MNRLKQVFVVLTVIGFVLGLTGSVFAANKAGSKAAHKMVKININTASAAELAKMKGVGKKLAENIIQYRKANGPFKTVKDLEKVKGITHKIVLKNEAILAVDTPAPVKKETPMQKPAPAMAPAPASKP
ncbi:MAG: helix-hairpin-helix domain-containing protein [Desulfobacteraceae bacterium]|nr:helix-hairpin-helix domain-containing protein [Desulfobacteraceae bacterium]